MSGSVTGYSYDIFISYRQNDNKYDGWVSDFYTNLKKELEATVKEKLTIYFDENPVDGLLEMHSVDKSIEEKLKSLIFIPVISQTYCDTNSYAWEYEFCAFNRFSVGDRFGREIKLANKNFASRILPVKIHELDAQDEALLEHEIGGKLRSIDFIYRSAGVNRPLRSHEDHPRNNLNKTYYRDQINKVANAIKEMLTILKSQNPNELNKTLSYEIPPSLNTSAEKRNWKKIAASLVIFLLILLVSGYIYFSSNIRISRSEDKSIAVLPFRNDSPSDSNTYFINGVMEEILNNLQKIKDLRIISRTSVEQFRNTSRPVSEIAKELGVNYLVEGSGQKYGNSFRINVQLIRAKKETYLWGQLYEQKIRIPGDIISVQSSIAKSIVAELRGTITPQEKMLIEKIPTTNLTAYDFYQKGKEEFSKFWIDVTNTKALSKAEYLYGKALKSDPKFAYAIVGMAEVYWNKHYYMKRENLLDSVLMMADLALSYDDKIADANVLKGWCYDDTGMYDKALAEYTRAIELNPNNWKAYYGLANLFYFDDPVKSLYNLHRAASLTHGSPELPTILRNIGGELLVTGFIEKALTYFSSAFEIDGDSAIYMSCLGGIEQNQGNYDKALQYYQLAYNLKKNYTEVVHNIALCYQMLGNHKEALRYFKEVELQNGLTYNMHRMGLAFWENGFRDEGEEYIKKQIDYSNSVLKTGRRSDQIAYTYYDLAGILAFKGDRKKAYQNLRLSNEGKNCFLYMVTLIKNDPLFNSLKQEPEFIKIINDMEVKFKRVHDEVGVWLETQKEI